MSAHLRWILRVGIVLSTVVALAFAAQYALVARRAAGPTSTLVLRTEELGAAQRERGRGELRIEHLIVDGALLRFESLEGATDWELRSKGGTASQLAQRRSPGPATLTLPRSSFLMFLKAGGWSGTLRAERDGSPTQAWELNAPDGEERGFVLEYPPAPASAATFGLVLLLGSVAAAWLGPLRGARSSLPWLICFLAAFHALFWLSHPTGVTNDSVAYVKQVAQLRAGVPGYFPPGYPLFVGIVESFAGQRLGSWIALLQHAMAVVAGVWSYRLLRGVVVEELALLAGILTGGLAPIVTSSQAIMSEIPTIFAMVGALYFTVRAAETGRVRFALVAGFLIGCAGILRVVPLASLIPAVGILLLLPVTRRGLRLAGATLSVAAAVVLLPMAWFWYKSGRPNLADSAGLHLFNRIVTEQKQLDETAPATRTLLRVLGGADPRSMPFWEIESHPGLSHLEGSEAETLLRNVAYESLWKDPWAYLAWTPGLAWREYLADPNGWIPRWAEMTASSALLENPPLLRVTAAGLHWRWVIDQVDRFLRPILSWGALAGVVIGMWSPQRKLVLALAWVVLSYLLATASLDSFAARYNVPIIPFVVALAMLPLGLLVPMAPRARAESLPALEPAA